MWEFIAYFVVALVVAYAMAPKPQTQKPQALEDVTAPTAEDGRKIPVLFGQKVINGSNIGWYGDFRSAPIYK